MNDYLENIERIIDNPSFKIFHSLGLIDEIALRNFLIKSEYKSLRKKYSQLDSIFFLSDKYNLSYDAIHTILFRIRKNKSPYFIPPK